MRSTNPETLYRREREKKARRIAKAAVVVKAAGAPHPGNGGHRGDNCVFSGAACDGAVTGVRGTKLCQGHRRMLDAMAKAPAPLPSPRRDYFARPEPIPATGRKRQAAAAGRAMRLDADAAMCVRRAA